MTGWLIFLTIIAAIAMVPVGASARYDEAGAEVKLILGPVKILLYPRPKKAKEKKTEPVQAEKTPEKEIPDGPPKGAPTKDMPKPKNGGSITEFLPLVDVAVDMLSSLRAKLQVNELQLLLILAADDPCDLAVNYGRAQAAGATLLAQLERFLVIKKRDVQIQCDFTADETKIVARVDLTITIGRMTGLAVVYGVRALTTFLKIKKQREGGAAL